jgi:hypothetical protein
MVLSLQRPFKCAAFMAVVVHEGEHTHFRAVYHLAKYSVRALLSVLLGVQGGLSASRRLLSSQTEFAWQILCEAEAGRFRRVPQIGDHQSRDRCDGDLAKNIGGEGRVNALISV